MKRYGSHAILFFVLVFLLAPVVAAQEQPPEFALPVARLGEDYRVEIESVLRDKYQLKLESGHANAIIVWAVATGEVPAGLSVRTDGTIIGDTKESRPGLYKFSLKAVDMATRDEPLELRFSLEVKAGRLRLSRLEGPRLVPVSPATPLTTDSAPTFNHASPTDLPDKNAGEPASPPKDDETPKPDIDSKRDAKEEEFTNPFSSLNKRFILGVEQSGAASAKSEGKPFLDLFINTPLLRDDEDEAEPARVSLWGDVRLTSTPEQIGAFANLPTSPIDSITGGDLNQLGLGFDFVVGPEVRLGRFHNVDMGLIAGFGAISPLSPKESVELFQVPDEKSSQAEAFFKEFPGAKGKKYIAFISPDRDRFLRQYFGGFRFKTYTREGGYIQNIFPTMLDITFGQSEAVTGGRLHKFVLGIDGFYVLPFPDKYRFLYLFGTAKFKVGGQKLSGTPFILDTPGSSVKATDPDVFIADPKPSNRDVYRLGFGVDLFELFRKKKS